MAYVPYVPPTLRWFREQEGVSLTDAAFLNEGQRLQSMQGTEGRALNKMSLHTFTRYFLALGFEVKVTVKGPSGTEYDVPTNLFTNPENVEHQRKRLIKKKGTAPPSPIKPKPKVKTKVIKTEGMTLTPTKGHLNPKKKSPHRGRVR